MDGVEECIPQERQNIEEIMTKERQTLQRWRGEGRIQAYVECSQTNVESGEGKRKGGMDEDGEYGQRDIQTTSCLLI